MLISHQISADIHEFANAVTDAKSTTATSHCIFLSVAVELPCCRNWRLLTLKGPSCAGIFSCRDIPSPTLHHLSRSQPLSLPPLSLSLSLFLSFSLSLCLAVFWPSFKHLPNIRQLGLNSVLPRQPRLKIASNEQLLPKSVPALNHLLRLPGVRSQPFISTRPRRSVGPAGSRPPSMPRSFCSLPVDTEPRF